MPFNGKLLKNIKPTIKRYEIADSDGLSIAEARELHRSARNEVSLGENPIEEKRECALLAKQAIQRLDS